MILLGALVSLGVATAADVASYPWQSSLALPAAGPARVVLGGDVLGLDPSHVATGLLVLDAQGTEVPYAVVPAWDGEVRKDSLFRRPIDATAWETEGGDRLYDAVSLDFDDLDGNGPFRVRVDTWDGGWRAGDSRIVYEWEDASGTTWANTTVPVPLSRGPFRIYAEALGRGAPELRFVEGVLHAPERVRPHSEPIELGPGVHTEEGRVRYVVDLPGPRMVTGVAFEVEGDLFERAVQIGVLGPDGRPSLSDTRTLRRVALGGARVDLVRAEGLALPTDVLVLEVEVGRDEPLVIPRLTVESAAAQIVVRDAGPGPHTLYAGGREGREAYDLGVGAFELLRMAGPAVELAASTANPGFVPLPTRAGVDAAAGTVNLARYRWARPLGGEGWVRVPLDHHVLVHARPDLGDLRVVDADGRQVPYLLRPSAAPGAWEGTTFTREEDLDENTTLLRVPLGDDAPPVATVMLETPARTFERTVEVLRDRGRMTETVRHVPWHGDDRGGRLTIELDETMGRELLLRIRNGDNPPLPIDSVTLTAPAWEVEVAAPAGARLVYGAKNVSAPHYDLSLLAAEVSGMHKGVATLGPAAALGGPTLSKMDKAVVVGAVGALALGLVGLLVRLLRAPAEGPEGGSKGDAEGGAASGPPVGAAGAP